MPLCCALRPRSLTARGRRTFCPLSQPVLQHIMIDLGTGNNNKINWALEEKQEFIDIVETVYRRAPEVHLIFPALSPTGIKT